MTDVLRDHWNRLRGWAYRSLMRLMHRFDLHHSRRSGPMEDGTTLHRCEWCGMRRVEVPLWVTRERMKAQRASGSPEGLVLPSTQPPAGASHLGGAAAPLEAR